MIKNLIGENAGKAWKCLDENGETSFSKLAKATNLNKEELLLAIGWLAREGKIYQTEPFTKNWKISLN
jgi:hypothetical protein